MTALRRSRVLAMVASALLVPTGCSAGGDDRAASTSSEAGTPAEALVSEVPPEPEAESPDPAPETREVPNPAYFPRGYPRKVRVANLPYQVRSWYRTDGYRRAVALAPGVWTPLPPGATVVDVIKTGTADGFCGSKKAYERKFLDGQELGGACW